MNQDLMLAILAMDSYNRRDPNPGPNTSPSAVGMEIEGTSVGLWNLSTQLDQSADSFYAQAYSCGGQIVISYRGMDSFSDIPDWGSGGGGYLTDQTILAAQFYRSIAAEHPGFEITLTGHSLGGGLAGFVGSIYGLDGVAFDTVSLDLAADRLCNSATTTSDPFRPGDRAIDSAERKKFGEDREPNGIDRFGSNDGAAEGEFFGARRSALIRPGKQKSMYRTVVSYARLLWMATVVLSLAPVNASAVEIYGRKLQRAYGWADTAKPVDALMQGVRYRIPQNYLDILEIELDGTSSGFLAVARVPDLQPRDSAAVLKRLRTGGYTEWANILVDAAPPDDTQKWFDINYQIYGGAREPFEFVGLNLGLREYRSTGPLPPRLGPYYRLEPSDPLGERLFITCTLKPPDRDPKLFSAGCSQFFTVDNLVVKVTYAARYVEDWAAIREATARLLRSFRE